MLQVRRPQHSRWVRSPRLRIVFSISAVLLILALPLLILSISPQAIAGSVVSMLLQAAPSTLTVGRTSTLTATVLGWGGTLIIGQEVNFSTSDDLGLGRIVPPAAMTGADGQATAVISSTVPGPKRVIAASGGMSATATVTFTVAPGEPYTISLAVYPPSPWITETARVTATVRGQNGSPLSGQVITFTSGGQIGSVIFGTVIFSGPVTGTTDVNGQVAVTVSSTSIGDKLVVAMASNSVTGVAHVYFRGIHYLHLPVVFKRFPSPPCAPQVWYTFPSYAPMWMGIAYDAATQRLYVANYNGILAVVDASSGHLIRLIPGLTGAWGVALDAARNRIYIVGGDRLYVVDNTTFNLLASIRVGAGSTAVAYHPANNKIYVSGYSSNSIAIVRADTLQVTTLTGSASLPINEPSYIAVNQANNKVYVANHNAGQLNGWVTVIDGATDQIRTNIYPTPGGDLYGIAVDSVHNRVYVASVGEARVYAIDSATDTLLGDIQIVRASDGRKVPLRMVAVNPTAPTETHLWLTSSSKDMFGQDQLIVLSFNATSWPPVPPMPVATTVAPSPMYGLLIDPASGYVFATNTTTNMVTVSRDNATLCMTPLSLSAGAEAEQLLAIAHDSSQLAPGR